MTQLTPSREHLFKSNRAFPRKRQFSKRKNLSKCFDYKLFNYSLLYLIELFIFRLHFVYGAKITKFLEWTNKLLHFSIATLELHTTVGTP